MSRCSVLIESFQSAGLLPTQAIPPGVSSIVGLDTLLLSSFS
jgi:hypothetical protein